MGREVFEDDINEALPPDVSAEAILDHLSAGKTYIEIDEPDGFVSLEGGEWWVARKRRGSYKIIGRFTNFLQALSCAVTPDLPMRKVA